MSAEDQTAAPDAPGTPEPEKATEQTTDWSDHLLALAREEGHTIGMEEPPPEAEVEGEPETLESEVPATEPEPEVEAPPAEPEIPKEPEAEEEQIAAKREGEWPVSAKTRVAEETAKRKRANERAEKAEALAAQYQEQLTKVITPAPTEDDPFRDIIDLNALEKLERSYEKAIDLADEYLNPTNEDGEPLYPYGAKDVVVGKDDSSNEIRRDFSRGQLTEMRHKADKAVRKFIPERKTYLQQRAIADQQAAQIYPEYQDPNSEFTQMAAVLAYRIMHGEAMKDPTILQWIGHAVRGYQEYVKRNGATTPNVKTPEARKIVESAQQKIAPTPTRSRSYPERAQGSVSLDKAAKKLEEKGDTDSAEEYVGALLSKSAGSAKRVERT